MVARRGWVLIGVGVGLLVLAAFLLQSTIGGLASNWAYEMTGIRAVQGAGLDGSGVTVAVIDTGFDPTHPSLGEINLVAWRDYVNDRPTPYDDAGHGNHVSGILAGKGTTFGGKLQGLDMKGVAPGINLIAVKAISNEGTGSSADVADGIRWAVTQNADVICLSLGSQPGILDGLGTSEIAQSVDRAINGGVVVVAAAGNTGQEENRDDVESPASQDKVIAVGAVDDDQRVAGFSADGNEEQNYGTKNAVTGERIAATASRPAPHQKPEIVAPGVRIQSAWKNGDYVRADGTSQAAPFVCGAIALLFQDEPALRNENSSSLIDRLKNRLRATAEPLSGQQTPHDPKAGYGLLRADRFVDAV